MAWTDESLQRLRRLVKTEEVSAWEIGDELLGLLPVGPVGVKTGVAAEIRKLAAEVDAEPRTLTEYRKVAHAWPDGTRVPSATWAAHRAYCGLPATAHVRAQMLASLPRNEHGRITKQAVTNMTKGASGKPGWHELLGLVGDALLRAEKQLGKAEAAFGDREYGDALAEKAASYAAVASDLADRLGRLADG